MATNSNSIEKYNKAKEIDVRWTSYAVVQATLACGCRRVNASAKME